jgi:hypothetical protein
VIVSRWPSAISLSILSTVEFHRGNPRASVSSLHTVATGAAIEALTW